MYVQQESLSQCGSFVVEIPSTSAKKEVYRSHVQTSSYVSRKRGNPTVHLNLKQFKVMILQFSKEECFFIVFSEVLKKSYCFLLIWVFMQV